MRSQPSIRQRNLRRRRPTKRRGNSRHNFKLNLRRPQCIHLFRRPPKQQRIATLQPHHHFMFSSRSHQQRINIVLRQPFLPAPLSHINPFHSRWNQSQYRRAHQRIVQHHSPSPQQPHRRHRQQIRIARPSSHQKYFAHHATPFFSSAEAACSTNCSSAARLAHVCRHRFTDSLSPPR